MAQVIDFQPDTNVLAAEYRRLLGYPVDAEMHERAVELSAWARSWYSAHGRPWVASRVIDQVTLTGSGVEIAGIPFSGARLERLLREANADRVAVVAVSAGPEAEAYAQRLWDEGKPDEYFFLEVYGSAVVEHLVMTAGAQLCAWADTQQLAVLPHDSPGYPDWDISEQAPLLRVLEHARCADSPLPLHVLESGMLRPKKSLLAVFGVSRHVERIERLTGLVPCEGCAYERCQFRRVPYRRSVGRTTTELPVPRENPAAARVNVIAGSLDRDAKYTVNAKALRRWAADRLALEHRADGSVRAEFRYDGTTCTNMGRPLAFLYRVTLGSRAEGYPIREQHCGPAPDDAGHTHMCKYISRGDDLMREIEDEKPLAGRRLDDIIGWSRPQASAGCYCDVESRAHKWGLVFETIHYALAREQDHAMAERPQEVRS